MNKIIKKDLHRYGKISIFHYLFGPEIRYLIMFRKIQSCNNSFFKLYYKYKLRLLSNKSHIQIPPETAIEPGFYIGHFGRIIINQNSKLGKNVNIATGVTIGQENRGKRKGCPTIGNKVWIGTNAVIVGNIRIGDDVLIAPLSYVNFDVPSHSIVIGNPAKIIHRDNATAGYINNIVD